MGAVGIVGEEEQQRAAPLDRVRLPCGREPAPEAAADLAHDAILRWLELGHQSTGSMGIKPLHHRHAVYWLSPGCGQDPLP